ncbi:MAG: ferredoxin [Desulfobacteraceae bacterium]
MKEQTGCRSVEIEMEECILCGICVEIAPQLFKLNDAGYIEVDVEGCSDSDILQQAVSNCPKNCIVVKDGSGRG